MWKHKLCDKNLCWNNKVSIFGRNWLAQSEHSPNQLLVLHSSASTCLKVGLFQNLHLSAFKRHQHGLTFLYPLSWSTLLNQWSWWLRSVCSEPQLFSVVPTWKRQLLFLSSIQYPSYPHGMSSLNKHSSMHEQKGSGWRPQMGWCLQTCISDWRSRHSETVWHLQNE